MIKILDKYEYPQEINMHEFMDNSIQAKHSTEEVNISNNPKIINSHFNSSIILCMLF